MLSPMFDFLEYPMIIFTPVPCSRFSHFGTSSPLPQYNDNLFDKLHHALFFYITETVFVMKTFSDVMIAYNISHIQL